MLLTNGDRTWDVDPGTEVERKLRREGFVEILPPITAPEETSSEGAADPEKAPATSDGPYPIPKAKK